MWGDSVSGRPRRLCLHAVIRTQSEGVVIELSDGRRCFFENGLYAVRNDGIAAAVNWAKRHGAASVHVVN